MPWTFAHPAAIVPLRRFCPFHLNLAALVVGSLAPDFGYYINLAGLANFAHTFPGSLLVCLPIGLGLLAVFYLVRRPISYLLPQPHRTLLEPLTTSPFPLRLMRVLGVLASVAIGAWTHIVWDSFTHQSGWVVNRVPALREFMPAGGFGQIPVYTFLQHLSTVLGVAALVTSYYFWMRRRSMTPILRFFRDDVWRYLLLVVLACASLAVALVFATDAAVIAPDHLALRVLVFRTAIYTTVLFIPMLILASLLCYVLRKES